MFQQLLSGWMDLWSDPELNRTVFVGGLAGLISALSMFVIGEVFWKSRVARVKEKTDLNWQRLNHLYAPLYQFYSNSLARFDQWQSQNPDTVLSREPFFDNDRDETYVEQLFEQYPSYASHSLLRLWSTYQVAEDKKRRSQVRDEMLKTLVKDFHQLRKSLGLDYDKQEAKTGEIRSLT